MVLSAYEPISLFTPSDKPPLVYKAKDDESEDGKKEEKPKSEKDHPGCG